MHQQSEMGSPVSLCNTSLSLSASSMIQLDLLNLIHYFSQCSILVFLPMQSGLKNLQYILLLWKSDRNVMLSLFKAPLFYFDWLSSIDGNLNHIVFLFIFMVLYSFNDY